MSSRTASYLNQGERSIIDSPTSVLQAGLTQISPLRIVQQTQRSGRAPKSILCVPMFWWFCFVSNFEACNATLFCNSNFVHLSEKDAGHEWSATPLIWTPVYGSVIPRIASFTMMDSLAYWNRARIGGRHSSGTSLKPGAPRHSACLGSPEFYRRSEGVFGWWVKTFTISRLRSRVPVEAQRRKREHK